MCSYGSGGAGLFRAASQLAASTSHWVFTWLPFGRVITDIATTERRLNPADGETPTQTDMP